LIALALAVLVLAAMIGGECVYDRRTQRIERERHERDVKALERELQVGLPLDVRVAAVSDAAYIASLPEPTPLGLHIDCLLRMGVITFAEWLALADEHKPLVWTSEPRFDAPTREDIGEADRRRRERWSREPPLPILTESFDRPPIHEDHRSREQLDAKP
jgi:hypothetical protein